MPYVRQKDFPGGAVFLVLMYTAIIFAMTVLSVFIKHQWFVLELGVRGEYDLFSTSVYGDCNQWIGVIRKACEAFTQTFNGLSMNEIIAFVCNTTQMIELLGGGGILDLTAGCAAFEAARFGHIIRVLFFLFSTIMLFFSLVCLTIYWNITREPILRRSIHGLNLMAVAAETIGVSMYIAHVGFMNTVIFHFDIPFVHETKTSPIDIDPGLLHLFWILFFTIPLPAISVLVLTSRYDNTYKPDITDEEEDFIPKRIHV